MVSYGAKKGKGNYANLCSIDDENCQAYFLIRSQTGISWLVKEHI